MSASGMLMRKCCCGGPPDCAAQYLCSISFSGTTGCACRSGRIDDPSDTNGTFDVTIDTAGPSGTYSNSVIDTSVFDHVTSYANSDCTGSTSTSSQRFQILLTLRCVGSTFEVYAIGTTIYNITPFPSPVPITLGVPLTLPGGPACNPALLYGGPTSVTVVITKI